MMLDRLGIVDTLGLSVGSRITRQRSYLSNLIVEVTNWETDYACKAEEYGLLSIPDLNPGLPGARWNCLYWSAQPTDVDCLSVSRSRLQAAALSSRTADCCLTSTTLPDFPDSPCPVGESPVIVVALARQLSLGTTKKE
jgi:hypothetical protein